MGISKSIDKSGLINILTNASEYHYHDVVVSANEFSVIINDGQRWVANHADALETRFNKDNSITEFYIVDPQSDFCIALQKKVFVEGQEKPAEKIAHTISFLNSTYGRSNKKGHLKVYYLKNYPTQTLFYTEDRVIVTPYQTSSGRAVVPLYEYKYTAGIPSIASHLKNDLIQVRQESTLVFEDGEFLVKG